MKTVDLIIDKGFAPKLLDFLFREPGWRHDKDWTIQLTPGNSQTMNGYHVVFTVTPIVTAKNKILKDLINEMSFHYSYRVKQNLLEMLDKNAPEIENAEMPSFQFDYTFDGDVSQSDLSLCGYSFTTSKDAAYSDKMINKWHSDIFNMRIFGHRISYFKIEQRIGGNIILSIRVHDV